MSYAKLGMAALAGLAAIRVREDYLGERNALLEAYKQQVRDTHEAYEAEKRAYEAARPYGLDPFISSRWRWRWGWSQFWRETFNSDRVRKALKLPLASSPRSTRVPAVKREHRAKVDGITWVVKPSTMSITRHGYADWPQRHDLRHRVFIESPCGRDIPAGRYQFHKCDVPHRGIKIRIPATQGRAARGRRGAKAVTTYTIDGKKISVEAHGRGANRYYEIWDDSTGTQLNVGEPWYDDEEGVPSREDVAWLLAQGRSARGRRAAKFPLRSKLPAGWKLVDGEYEKTYAKGVLKGTVVKYGKKYEGYFTAQGRTGFPAIEMSVSPGKIARELDKIVAGYRSPATAAAALRQSSRY